MKGITIIKPMALTDAMLVSSTVPEADYAVWAAGTTYALAARVIKNHVIYESLAASNVDNDPELAGTTKWVAVSATNRWKLFDLSSSSQTAQSTSMSYTLRPGQFVTSVAAVNLTDVTSVRVQMISDAFGLVYDETLSRPRIQPEANWWSWFYGKRTEPLASYYTNLPSFLDAQIIVTFTGGAAMAVGTLILGTSSQWGKCVTVGVSLGIKDYSRKDVNTYGDTVLVKRRYSTQVEVPLALETAQTDAFFNFVAGMRATPALWIVSDEFESTTVYGYYTSFKVLIQYRDLSDCTLNLESLA
ncbi:hypothetical protein AEP_00514 [Curvibacter sp. AEP1-3]|uniref:carbohydrate-binding protein n=1 Tax=Curvibacter sp. AEP1-3 TaxID=1844971 RepID=UPI000B578626|nr:carbohydrate-binding protein [Curvibacter sp. AEP1-3]ARV17474.1 hypothetical protein AEP_00514 [Curvibacter sp. AEP1-3]